MVNKALAPFTPKKQCSRRENSRCHHRRQWRDLYPTEGVQLHASKSMNVPFASGSNAFDTMVILPCTMGTLGRIAHGISDDALLRAADVMLKENKILILCPRETPLSLVHVKNMELLLLSGATMMPTNPYFYSEAKTLEDLADTVVARVLDHLGVENEISPRWRKEED